MPICFQRLLKCNVLETFYPQIKRDKTGYQVNRWKHNKISAKSMQSFHSVYMYSTEVCAAPGHVYVTGTGAAPGLCLHYKGLFSIYCSYRITSCTLSTWMWRCMGCDFDTYFNFFNFCISAYFSWNLNWSLSHRLLQEKIYFLY